MRFDVLTLFPELLSGALEHSIPARALASGQVEVGLHDIRDYSTNKHRNVDDTPYGGGAGMVMQAEPVVAALEALAASRTIATTIYLSPSGGRFDQAKARALAGVDGGTVVLICGRYEGLDERVIAGWCDEELSIGDYVLSGGEPAALVVIDAVSRLVPGVLGNAASTVEESLEGGVLEYPQYTRPRSFRDADVPDVLLSGNHAEIERWRRCQSLTRTKERRPDLWAELSLSTNDKKLLES